MNVHSLRPKGCKSLPGPCSFMFSICIVFDSLFEIHAPVRFRLQYLFCWTMIRRQIIFWFDGTNQRKNAGSGEGNDYPFSVCIYKLLTFLIFVRRNSLSLKNISSSVARSAIGPVAIPPTQRLAVRTRLQQSSPTDLVLFFNRF